MLLNSIWEYSNIFLYFLTTFLAPWILQNVSIVTKRILCSNKIASQTPIANIIRKHMCFQNSVFRTKICKKVAKYNQQIWCYYRKCGQLKDEKKECHRQENNSPNKYIARFWKFYFCTICTVAIVWRHLNEFDQSAPKS